MLIVNSVAFEAVVRSVMSNHSLEGFDKGFYNISFFFSVLICSNRVILYLGNNLIVPVSECVKLQQFP